MTLYSDCREIFDQMLSRKGGRARFSTTREAIRFRQRCNMFRKAHNDELARSYEGTGASPENPYYRFTLGLEGCDVVFRLDDHSKITELLFNSPGEAIDNG